MVSYFEESWAILSTIGIVNLCFGFTVISITKFSDVICIPIVVSLACAVGNGLCYYAFYADYPVVNTAVASGFSDFFWLIQEVGISFYSYVILSRLLSRGSRVIFMTVFWALVVAIVALRLGIIVGRIKLILDPNSNYQDIVRYFHVGYFVSMAALECNSAVFLLRQFSSARKNSPYTSNHTLMRHLMRGTEIRVASLALIGVSRATVYIFNPSLPQAATTAGQIDRFLYTFECMFPIMLYIDILACQIKFAEQRSHAMNPVASPAVVNRGFPIDADLEAPKFSEHQNEGLGRSRRSEAVLARQLTSNARPNSGDSFGSTPRLVRDTQSNFGDP